MANLKRMLINNGSWGYIGILSDGVFFALWNHELTIEQAREIANNLNKACDQIEKEGRK